MSSDICVSCAEVYWQLSDSEEGNAQELAELTRFAKSTVQKHLTTLERSGVIQGMGRPKRYRLNHNSSSGLLPQLQELEPIARRISRHVQTRLLPTRTQPLSGEDYFDFRRHTFNVLELPNLSAVLQEMGGSQELATYLFSSAAKAQEVAWSLRANWDGLNAVSIPAHEDITLKTAAGLAGAEYCRQGENRPVLFKAGIPKVGCGKSHLMSEIIVHTVVLQERAVSVELITSGREYPPICIDL